MQLALILIHQLSFQGSLSDLNADMQVTRIYQQVHGPTL